MKHNRNSQKQAEQNHDQAVARLRRGMAACLSAAALVLAGWTAPLTGAAQSNQTAQPSQGPSADSSAGNIVGTSVQTSQVQAGAYRVHLGDVANADSESAGSAGSGSTSADADQTNTDLQKNTIISEESGEGGFIFPEAIITQGTAPIRTMIISVDSGSFTVPAGYGTYLFNRGGTMSNQGRATTDVLISFSSTQAENAQELLRQVRFYPERKEQDIYVEISASGTSIPTGNAFAMDQSTGHRYVFVSVPGSCAWNYAYNAAKTYTLCGMRGYLIALDGENETSCASAVAGVPVWTSATMLTSPAGAKITDPSAVTAAAVPAGATAGNQISGVSGADGSSGASTGASGTAGTSAGTAQRQALYYWAAGPSAGQEVNGGLWGKNQPDNTPNDGGAGVSNALNLGAGAADGQKVESCGVLEPSEDYLLHDLPEGSLSGASEAPKGYIVEFSDYNRAQDAGTLTASTSAELSVPTVVVTYHLGDEGTFRRSFAEQYGLNPDSDSSESSSGSSKSDPAIRTLQVGILAGARLGSEGYTMGTASMTGSTFRNMGNIQNTKAMLLCWTDKSGEVYDADSAVSGDLDLYARWLRYDQLYPKITLQVSGNGHFTSAPEVRTEKDEDGRTEAAGTVSRSTDRTGKAVYTISADLLAAAACPSGTFAKLRRTVSSRTGSGAKDYREAAENIAEALNAELTVGDIISALPEWDAENDNTLTKWTGGDHSVYTSAELKKAPLDGSQTYTANFRKIVYKLRYSLDGGTNSRRNPSEYVVTDSKFKLEKPTKEGYTFAGWYTDASFDHRITSLSSSSITSDTTLYAKWQRNRNTEYIVEHYIDRGGEYSLKKTQKKKGETDSMVTAQPIAISGYECDTTIAGTRSMGTVKGDGSLVLKLYYKRK